MGPVAPASPLHTRSVSTNGAVPPINGVMGNGGPPSALPAGKTSGAGDGTKSVSRVFPHIEDLTSVVPDVDIHSPIRKILAYGELLAKQADSSLEFKRPDIALTEYIKAFTVATDIIPRHKDYPTVQTDRGELHRCYAGLMKRINAQNGKFAEVKDLIKENNARTGVRPKAQKDLPTAPSESQGDRAESNENLHQSRNSELANDRIQDFEQTANGDYGRSNAANGVPMRKKPPVLPKPNALHGNALKPSAPAHSSSPTGDLAVRFARLRSPDSTTPQQDPRIHTQPISIPQTPEHNVKHSNPSQNLLQVARPSTINRPMGLRDLPSVPLTIPQVAKIDRFGQMPGMPRPPDAIYSPSRGTEIAGPFNLTSSSSRSSSYLDNAKKTAAPPISTVGPTPLSTEGRQDYFSLAEKVDDDRTNSMSKKPQGPSLPDSTTITAEDLTKYLALGSQNFRILVVDLRSREEFDSGHIMSQSIICIEPIALRRGMSAEDLEEGLVLTPDSEYRLYQKRREFDLVVFYDQNSSEIRPRSFNSNDGADCLHNFLQALTEYTYEKPLKRPPRLLLGGLDAWIDLMGVGSLQTSSTATVSKAAPTRARPMGAIPRKSIGVARQRTYHSRPLSNDEESKWDASLREETAKTYTGEASSPDEFSYARTTEDFFRRYPELPVIQESMVSQPMVPLKQAHHHDFANSIPRPPTRPAPALPRQRSGGLSERGPTTYSNSAGYNAQQSSITAPRVVRGLTGLSNPAVLCYMNTAVQAISATEFLREHLLRFTYPTDPPLPRKPNERSDPPQLLVRNLGNLLGHLWSGQYDFVTPKTFSAYCNAIAVAHKGVRAREEAFGGLKVQHDATDFLWFLIEVLDDELNYKRHVTAPPKVTDDQEKILNTKSYLWGCYNRWQALLQTEDSIITHWMKFLNIAVIRCENCGSERRSWEPYPYLTLEIAKSGTETIDAALRRQYGRQDDIIEDFKCDSKICKDSEQRQRRTVYLGHLPDYLIISFNRYSYENDRNGTQKLHTKVTFPERGIDLTPAAFPQSDPPSEEDREIHGHAFRGPYIYDCYAVIQHQGSTANAGHYWTLAKSPDGSGKGSRSLVWNRFNDSSVEPASFGQTQSSLTSVLFLRRRANPRGG